MPSARKVRWAQLKVGIMAIVAMILLGILVFLLTGTQSLFADKATIYTYMEDSAALTSGSPVRLNGILIGQITSVELSGENVPNRIVRIAMEVDRSMLSQIPVDSTAAVSAENVLGTKYINIARGQSSATVKAGGEIPSLNTREFQEIVASGYATLTALQGILKRVDAIVSQIELGKGSIGKLLVDEELYDHLTGTVAEAEKVTTALASGKGTMGKLLYDESLYDEIHSSVARADQLIEDLQQGQGTAGRLLKDPALYNEAQKVVRELQQLVANLNAGKGTAGKLLTSDELHEQIRTTLADVNRLFETINGGQGTLGQLTVNPQLYESVNGLTREMQGLIKDFRANPKKFLHVKLSLF